MSNVTDLWKPQITNANENGRQNPLNCWSFLTCLHHRCIMRILTSMVLIVAASATVIDVKNCPSTDSSVCSIQEIRIDPCELTSNNVCKLTKGQYAEISFDFTPNFTTDMLTTDVKYLTTSWGTLDTDGCKATTCPTVAGTNQTYAVKLRIGRLLPAGSFPVQWSVWDSKNTTNKCCFKTTFKLPKTK